MDKLSDKEELLMLEGRIKMAKEEGRPFDKYVAREIEILGESLNSFLADMEKENKLDEFETIEIQIRQYAAMRELSKKINAPTEKYDKLIKDLQIKVVGAENYENFFGNSKS
jgi:hypothetical protein